MDMESLLLVYTYAIRGLKFTSVGCGSSSLPLHKAELNVFAGLWHIILHTPHWSEVKTYHRLAAAYPLGGGYTQHVLLNVEATHFTNSTNVVEVAAILAQSLRLTAVLPIKVMCTTWQHEISTMVRWPANDKCMNGYLHGCTISPHVYMSKKMIWVIWFWHEESRQILESSMCFILKPDIIHSKHAIQHIRESMDQVDTQIWHCPRTMMTKDNSNHDFPFKIVQ